MRLNKFIYLPHNKTALKKLFLIILIPVLALSQFGYYLLMSDARFSQKEAIKEEIKRNLKDEELQIISFTENQQSITWEEEGKEFFFNNQMFDVVKIKTVNGKILLYCINDQKEKSLVDNCNTITKHNSSSDKKGKNNIDNTFNLFLSSEVKSDNSYFIFPLNSFSPFVAHLPKTLLNKISPPPKA